MWSRSYFFFWYSFRAHCHLFKVSLLFISLSCDLFLFFQMIWRRNMMESQLTWPLPSFRPSGSLTALTIPLCTPSWTRTSRRAASLPSPTASKKLTSGVLLWRRPNWVCSSSNLRLEKPSSSQMQATVHSSAQHWKALQVPRVERARWKQVKKTPSRQNSLRKAPLKSNEGAHAGVADAERQPPVRRHHQLQVHRIQVSQLLFKDSKEERRAAGRKLSHCERRQFSSWLGSRLITEHQFARCESKRNFCWAAYEVCGA